MLILGGRYGSIEDISKKSYTHLEYEYAIELGKPFFAIVIKDDWTNKKAKKKGVKIADFIEVDNLDKLQEFKKTVLTKIVKFAEDLKDIKLALGESLNEMSRRDNLKGWVKADDTDYSSISEELARLSKENNELKSQLAFQNNDEEIKMIDFLKGTKVSNTYEVQTIIYTVETLFDYFIGIAHRFHFNHGVNDIDDLKQLQAHHLVSEEAYRLSDKGKSLFSYIEINNIERQERLPFYNVQVVVFQ